MDILLDPLMIKDSDGVTVNPATAELIETLQELSQRLAPLAGAMAPNATIRVQGISMPSTAVTGPITTAQHIANTLVEKIAIANLTAIQANINNTIGA